MKACLWLAVLCLGLCGCVTAAGRQASADVAAETAVAAQAGCPAGDPGMTAAAREAEGVRRQVGGPAPVRRPPEAMNATAEKVEADIAQWERFKAAGGWLLQAAQGWPGVGTAVTFALGAGAWLLRKKKQVEEAGNRIASTYRENVPEGVRAAIDGKLAEVLKSKGLPVAQAEKFVGWENVPD